MTLDFWMLDFRQWNLEIVANTLPHHPLFPLPKVQKSNVLKKQNPGILRPPGFLVVSPGIGTKLLTPMEINSLGANKKCQWRNSGVFKIHYLFTLLFKCLITNDLWRVWCFLFLTDCL